MPLTDLSFLALHKDGTLLGEFLEEMAADEPGWRLGAALRIPRGRLPYNVAKLDDWALNADYVLADPETRQMILPFRNRGGGRNDHAYLSESDPAANRDRFVTQVLRAQLNAGADVLISPWLIHGTGGTSHELAVTMDLARRAIDHKLSDGRTLLIGVEATETIFASKGTRDALLDEITELEGVPVYLRMTTSAALTGNRQYDNIPALRGLREAVEALVGNDHTVLLPQSGVAGWLMLGYGAYCFGAGVSGTLQRSGMPVASRRGGGQPLQWYFHPQLLGFVLADELADLETVSGIDACDCPYCDASPPTPGAGFDRVAAEKHFLRWCVKAADDVRRASNREAAVQHRVEAAEQHWQSVQSARVVLDARSRPTHLGAWLRVVA
jgi:hypothetical protein